MSKRIKSKARAKRLARKRAMRWVSSATRDTMSAARRLYGRGLAA